MTEYSFSKMFFTKWQKFATNKSLVESCQSCIYGEILSPLGVVTGSVCYPLIISICQPKGSSPSHCAKRKYSLAKAPKTTIELLLSVNWSSKVVRSLAGARVEIILTEIMSIVYLLLIHSRLAQFTCTHPRREYATVTW